MGIKPSDVAEADVDFIPDVTVAYISREGSAEPLLEAWREVHAQPAGVQVPAASLIVLDRDHRMYQWVEHSVVRLAIS